MFFHTCKLTAINPFFRLTRSAQYRTHNATAAFSFRASPIHETHRGLRSICMKTGACLEPMQETFVPSTGVPPLN